MAYAISIIREKTSFGRGLSPPVAHRKQQYKTHK